MPDDAGNERRAGRQFYLLKDAPFMLVARVRGLDRIAPGIDPENQVDDVLQWDVVVVRTVKAAPADMEAHLLLRDAAQRMVQRIDPDFGVFAVFGGGDVG